MTLRMPTRLRCSRADSGQPGRRQIFQQCPRYAYQNFSSSRWTATQVRFGSTSSSDPGDVKAPPARTCGATGSASLQRLVNRSTMDLAGVITSGVDRPTGRCTRWYSDSSIRAYLFRGTLGMV